MMTGMAVVASEIKKEKSDVSICRLCFTERNNYRLIFVDEYSSLHEWIENLTSLKIMKLPNAPASLCLECENTLQNFESFREMCFTNDRVIKEMFNQDDSRNDFAAVPEAMSVINEINTDQCKDQKTEILSYITNAKVDNADIKIESDQCEAQQTDILESIMHTQVDNNTGITIEYQNIKFEVDSSVDSEDDDDKQKDTEEVLELEKGESFVETVTKGKRRHICSLCDKEFTNSNRLKIHIRSHTQERPHKCKDCGKSFITPSNLKRHMRSHSGLKPYSCDVCQAKYSQSCHLVRHKRIHLRKDLLSTTKSLEENESSRDTGESEKGDTLLEPMKGNGKSKKHCTICNKFVFKLKDHQIIHKEIRPYQCKDCPKAYNQKYKLTVHTRTHTNEKPYICGYCDKAFTNAGDMKIHIRSHTQERPFKCKECNKSFITVSHLGQHEKTHSAIKPYSCDICHGKFTQKVHLTSHKQVHHKSTSQQVDSKSTTVTAEASDFKS